MQYNPHPCTRYQLHAWDGDFLVQVIPVPSQCLPIVWRGYTWSSSENCGFAVSCNLEDIDKPSPPNPRQTTSMISDGAGDNSYPKDRYPSNDVLHITAKKFSIAYSHRRLGHCLDQRDLSMCHNHLTALAKYSRLTCS